jgi:putative SOS response-associated peptidase YedK
VSHGDRSGKLKRMCGRYQRRSDKQRIAEVFQVRVGLEDLYLDTEDDIAPGSVQPVVLSSADGERRIERMRWGFKLPDRLLFNARSEGIDVAKFWSDRFKTGRCIVPADTFFEWAKAAEGRKSKYEFAVPGREPFGMAGVWSVWKNPRTDAWEDTFAVLTRDANSVMQPVHNRQPIILEPREYAEYLAPTDRPPIHLLRVLPDEDLRSQRISDDTMSKEQTRLFESQ